MGDKAAVPIDEIINRLWSSDFGGQWSAEDPSTIYYYGDAATASVLGTFGAAGMQINLSGLGAGGGGGSSFSFGNLFNTSHLTNSEAVKFTTLINEIKSTNIGSALLNAMMAFQQIINVTNTPFPQEVQNNFLIFSLYFWKTNELRMSDKLSDPDINTWSLLENLAHELFHAYQDFNELKQAGDGDEPDAYIFESLFDRQYQNGVMSKDFWNREINQNLMNAAQYNFKEAWINFFDNGYMREDYTSIYNNFIEGSVDGGQYTGPINVAMGGYLIYNLLPH